MGRCYDLIPGKPYRINDKTQTVKEVTTVAGHKTNIEINGSYLQNDNREDTMV